MHRSVFLVLVSTIVSYCEGYSSTFDNYLYETVLNSTECDEQLHFLVNSTLKWRFIDASAKIPSGILSGNVNDLGDYYQCLDINQHIKNMDVQGKYCTVTVPLDQVIQLPEWPDVNWPNITLPEIPRPPLDNETMRDIESYYKLRKWAMMMASLDRQVDSVEDISTRVFPMMTTAQYGPTFAICIPKVCSTKQAMDFIQDRYPFFNIEYNESFCRLPNDKPFTPADKVAITVFSIIGFLIIISTAYDCYHVFILKTETNVLHRAFSVYTNTRRFLTFKTHPGALECVDGIRAISMAWVVIGHTYALTLLGFVHNLEETLGWLRKFSSTWVNSAPLTVDTFFLLSGLLGVYTTVGKISRDRFIRVIHLFYINRLLRMFPLLATMVLLQASLLNHVSDGPFWQNVALATENCRQYWWSALLHIQNYVNSNQICLTHTWYLSVDMQLYIVCPIILLMLFGDKKIAYIALAGILLLSLVSSTLISFLYNFSAALAHPDRISEFGNYAKYYYFNTLARAPPFFVGMIFGYLLHLWKDRNIRISKINVALLWSLSFAMMAFCIFSVYPVMQLEHDAQIFDNFLNAYMRTIWSSAVGWLIFACVNGYGGPINWFLSLHMWKLPARLSYAMYLVHFPIIMIANGSWVKTHYFTNGDNLYRFMADRLLVHIPRCICFVHRHRLLKCSILYVAKTFVGRRRK
ncbi:nose resistant to fluoxetine protein 6-like isoform X1 [Galleria mellonella]|uniref:Nose resistant to fluoxetine protein 6-like isoform X1 n=1 Tax=Galleria mellonella TaxID=7137 RepID=A0ABM3N7M7_GALME|nr:nose resistant to fluoxetine protein 6-like isoform X1 [Galleria mellonella]